MSLTQDQQWILNRLHDGGTVTVERDEDTQHTLSWPDTRRHPPYWRIDRVDAVDVEVLILRDLAVLGEPDGNGHRIVQVAS